MTGVTTLLAGIKTREEAAAKGFHGAMTNPVSFASDWADEIEAALAAADAHDAANGIHRVSLDDTTVERAARALQELEGYGWLSMTAEIHMKKARAVLAAAVEAGQ